jgi:hypothetical protein
LLKEGAVAHGSPASTTVLSFGNGPLLTTTLSYLSSRAKPRDLRFRGPFVEKLFELGSRPVVGGDQFSFVVDEQEGCAAVFQLTREAFATARVVKLYCLLI